MLYDIPYYFNRYLVQPVVRNAGVGRLFAAKMDLCGLVVLLHLKIMRKQDFYNISITSKDPQDNFRPHRFDA